MSQGNSQLADIHRKSILSIYAHMYFVLYLYSRLPYSFGYSFSASSPFPHFLA